MYKSYIFSLFIMAIAVTVYIYHIPVLAPKDCIKHFAGKIVVVTGSSSGIGEQLAYQLSQCQANLVLIARRKLRLNEVKKKCLELGSKSVDVIPYDFVDVEGIPGLVDNIISMTGVVHHLVLNHAKIIYGSLHKKPKQIEPEVLLPMFKVNVASTARLAVLMRPMLETTSGSIYITSTGLAEYPLRHMFMYSTTKHSLNGFTYNLQQELVQTNSNVSVTLGNLGIIRTDDINNLIEHGLGIPRVFVGDIEECADLMISSLVYKPRTMNYPVVFSHLQRFMWNYVPMFHEINNLYPASEETVEN